MLGLDRYQRAPDFLADAGAWLAERDSEHNLILGIAAGLGDDERSASGDPRCFAVVRDGGPRCDRQPHLPGGHRLRACD